MFKLAIWISILLVVVSLVLIAPSMNPALAASSVEQDSDSGSEDIVIAANTQLARDLSARDEIIATRIDAAYLGERRLKPYYIEVTVKQGVVTLKGAVASEDERRLALLIASE
ncbi:MAG: BON domain-containing protein, partial [Nevskiales bacterium]